MNYAEALKKAIAEAAPLKFEYSSDLLRQRIGDITAQLKKPMSDEERIALCADRASLRKTLLHSLRRCDGCKFWSEKIAEAKSDGPVVALCLNKSASTHGKMVYAGCDRYEAGEPIDLRW